MEVRYGSGFVPAHTSLRQGDTVVLLDLVSNGKKKPHDWFCRTHQGERYGHVGEQYLDYTGGRS